jgi:hypothetical protein
MAKTKETQDYCSFYEYVSMTMETGEKEIQVITNDPVFVLIGTDIVRLVEGSLANIEAGGDPGKYSVNGLEREVARTLAASIMGQVPAPERDQMAAVLAKSLVESGRARVLLRFCPEVLGKVLKGQ